MTRTRLIKLVLSGTAIMAIASVMPAYAQVSFFDVIDDRNLFEKGLDIVSLVMDSDPWSNMIYMVTALPASILALFMLATGPVNRASPLWKRLLTGFAVATIIVCYFDFRM